MVTELPAAGQQWRHYKGGIYRVFGLAHWSVTGDMAVVYQSIDGGEIWVRPLGEWLGFTDDHKRRFLMVPEDDSQDRLPLEPNQ